MGRRCGAQLQVVTGRGTEFVEVKPNPNSVTGIVRSLDGRSPVSGGIVLVTLIGGRGKARRNETLKANMRGDRFELKFEGKWESLRLYYLPEPEFADCKAGPFRL